MIPDPVAFRILSKQWYKELKVLLDQQRDLLLGQCAACFLGSTTVGLLCLIVMLGAFVRLGLELLSDDVLEKSATIVPDCVVLGILREELRRQLKSFIREISGSDLVGKLASSGV